MESSMRLLPPPSPDYDRLDLLSLLSFFKRCFMSNHATGLRRLVPLLLLLLHHT